MSFVQHKFGRYIILEPLAVGGMAEIFLAKLADEIVGGPVRILVIKKVIGSYSGNEDFVRMFEDEIKITAGFSHQCIVQIYDYGRAEDTSFLAMEYVEGKTLRQFLVRLVERKLKFSVDISCHVISQVASALDYAHSFQDRLEGEHLGIVHRDISPQNIMISYNGSVKLFDFGIAKAKSTAQETRAGIIKGKPSYLSPEQISGDELDGRSDIFALGVVFWESLTGRRLFYGESDIQILRMIQRGKMESPSVYNPEVPPELDAIVLRALHRDKKKRYQTAEELQKDLHAFIYSYNPKFNPADLGTYALKFFGKEASEAKENLKVALEACRRNGIGQSGGSKSVGNLDELFGSYRQKKSSFTSTGSEISRIFKTEEKQRFTKRPKQAKEMSERGKGKESVVPPWSVSKNELVKATRVMRKKEEKRIGPVGQEINSFFLLLLVIAPVAWFFFFGSKKGAEDSNVTENTVVEQNTEQAVVETSLEEENLSSGYTPAKLYFQTSVRRYEVFLNGRRAQLRSGSVILPKERPVSVLIQKPHYKDIRFSINDDSSQNITRPIVFKRLSYGFLTLTTDPGADITLQKVGGRSPSSVYSPVRNKQLSVGTYNILIENELIGYRERIQINIKKGKTIRIHKDLN